MKRSLKNPAERSHFTPHNIATTTNRLLYRAKEAVPSLADFRTTVVPERRSLDDFE
jgi:hypothetical protein